MSVDKLLLSLNSRQRMAATMADQHALVLAGAGTGKTNTIVARAAFLIQSGVLAHRIQILTFTRRAASEIVTRVKAQLGDRANGLQASTFHTWCMGLVRKSAALGARNSTVIDGEDQLQLIRPIRVKSKCPPTDLPTADELRDLYSYARNTNQSLTAALTRSHPDHLIAKPHIAAIFKRYEAKKRERHYLDYDDILSVVATGMSESPRIRAWVGKQYDHILVDEMQDSNPLQWSLLSPLTDTCTLFCVGDDAQSIYGFRGADFNNVHSFEERVPGSVVLKLTKNYRSTQEILDVANWLLKDSPLNYGKTLTAARGHGFRPQLHNFGDEWAESDWIVRDILQRRTDGDDWRDQMILTRTAYSARAIERSLLAAEIPYRFIGGVKLLESAHVRDVLSLLRLIANPHDEIAAMRYLSLFPGVGDATASRVADMLMKAGSLEDGIDGLENERRLPPLATQAMRKTLLRRHSVYMAINTAVKMLTPILEDKYRNQDWPKRQRDFLLLAKLAERHSNILAFIEEYVLDPIHSTMVERKDNDDVVTIITIHSAKGTQCKNCYVINVSPGAYPTTKAIGNANQVEEERRVLYVALTRAEDNLIVTRQTHNTWAFTSTAASTNELSDQAVECYFFNDLPKGLFEEVTHRRVTKFASPANGRNGKFAAPHGINLE
jgi:DNA helicase-2/ATP-dependent DNA helicase PcrA